MQNSTPSLFTPKTSTLTKLKAFARAYRPMMQSAIATASACEAPLNRPVMLVK